MTDPIRVLWFIKGLDYGGAERLIEFMLAHTDHERFNVEIAYVMRPYAALVPQIARHGVRIHNLGADHDYDLSWVPRLRRLVKTGRFQILHAHSPLTAAIARLVLPRDLVHVYTEHSDWSLYRPITRLLNSATYSRNAAVIAVSGSAAASVRRPRWLPLARFPPVKVVYHGFDDLEVRTGPEARRRARADLGFADSAVVVGCLANLRAEKNHVMLLDAFAALAREDVRLRLVLIGYGPLEAELKDKVVRDGLDDRVLFTGYRDDARALLPGFDIFALSSHAEGLPIALLEAMATGLPVTATSVGGVPEVISDGAEGYLVPANDTAAFTNALRRLLDDERRAQMGSQASRAADRFSISQAAQRIERIYETVTSDRPG